MFLWSKDGVKLIKLYITHLHPIIKSEKYNAHWEKTEK